MVRRHDSESWNTKQGSSGSSAGRLQQRLPLRSIASLETLVRFLPHQLDAEQPACVRLLGSCAHRRHGPFLDHGQTWPDLSRSGRHGNCSERDPRPDGHDRTVHKRSVNWDANLDWRSLRLGYLKAILSSNHAATDVAGESKKKNSLKMKREAGGGKGQPRRDHGSPPNMTVNSKKRRWPKLRFDGR